MRFFVSSEKQKEVIDITERINQMLHQENVRAGVCLLFIKHTTAAVTTADLDPGTDLDMLDAFEALMPKLHYRHPHNPQHVTDHILSSIIGPAVMLPVVDGELDLGTWQRVVMIDFDGPRERELTLQIL